MSNSGVIQAAVMVKNKTQRQTHNKRRMDNVSNIAILCQTQLMALKSESLETVLLVCQMLHITWFTTRTVQVGTQCDLGASGFKLGRRKNINLACWKRLDVHVAIVRVQ